MAKRRPAPEIVTVWDECQNRDNCRFGLRGVVVGVGGTDDVVDSAAWGEDGHLMLTLWGGGVVRAEVATLRSIWSVCCCRPKYRHKLNAVTEEMRGHILARDGYQCRECGSTEALQIDHIRPVSKGGTDKENNLQTLCRLCNIRKSAKWEDGG